MLISGKSSNIFSHIDGRCSAAVSVAMRGRKPDNGEQGRKHAHAMRLF